MLGGKQGPLWSWVVGWLNLLGQVCGGSQQPGAMRDGVAIERLKSQAS